MAPGSLSNSYAPIRTLAASERVTPAARQEQRGWTSMTAMSIRQELTTGPKPWAQRDAHRHESESASRGTRSKSRVGQVLRRPDAKILNEAIPLVAIGRNQAGFWVARDCDSSTGRMFIFKGSAIRFAKRMKGPSGCALMFVNDGLELEPAATGASHFSPLETVARTLLVWRAHLRQCVQRIQGRTALKS